MLPGMIISKDEFIEKVRDAFMHIHASNCFGPNPPSKKEVLKEAIESVLFLFEAGIPTSPVINADTAVANSLINDIVHKIESGSW